ncbi:hypothetical protein MTO96_025595 [Rhipicephalus appendiculatus]
MCLVDKISSPSFTANQRDQPWMTSAHVTLPEDLKVKPTPLYSSGQRSSEMGNTLRNPFLYVFQVAAMLTRCEFLLGCRSATASWKHDIGRLRIPLSDPGDMCLVDKISSPSFTANQRDQPWMTSAHVTLPEDLKVKPTPLYSSGQRSSEMGNTLRNPFLYVFQVAAMLTRCEFLLGCRSATASWKHDIGRLRIPLSDPGDMCLVDKISSPSFTANQRDQPWMTSAHVTLPEDLKVKPTPLYSSGQRSSEMGNTLRNPFLYVFQVAAMLTRCEFLLGCRSATASWKHDIGRLRIPLSDPGDMCLVDKISSPSFTANQRDQPWMTSAHVTLPEGLKSEANTALLQWAAQQRNGQHAKEPLFVRLPGCGYADEVRVFVGLPLSNCLVET